MTATLLPMALAGTELDTESSIKKAPNSAIANVVRIRCFSEIEEQAHCADVALPAQLPLAEILPDLVTLLHPDAAAGAHWTLLNQRGKSLALTQTALEAGLRPGERLTLTQSAFAPPAARVTDAALCLAKDPLPLEPGKMDLWVGATVALLTSAALAIWWAVFSPLEPPLGSLIAAGIAALSLGLTAAALQIKAIPALVTSVFAIQSYIFAALAAALFVNSQWHWQLLAAATTTTALSATGAILVPGARRLSTASATVAFAGMTFAALVTFNLEVYAAAAATIGISLVGMVLTPSVSVGLSGIHIPDVPAAGEALDKADRRQSPTVVVQVAARAGALFDGFIAGWMVAASCSAVAVAQSHASWWIFALLLTAAGACSIQSRGQARPIPGFSLALGAAVVLAAGCYVAFSLSAWWAATPLMLLLLAAMPISFGIHLWQAPSPAARRAIELAEAVCLGAALPLAIVVTGLVEFIRGLG